MLNNFYQYFSLIGDCSCLLEESLTNEVCGSNPAIRIFLLLLPFLPVVGHYEPQLVVLTKCTSTCAIRAMKFRPSIPGTY